MEPVAVIALLVVGRAVFLPRLDWCVSPMASFSTVSARGALCIVICPFWIVVCAFRGIVLALPVLAFGALDSRVMGSVCWRTVFLPPWLLCVEKHPPATGLDSSLLVCQAVFRGLLSL